jgi:hypothetical protein
VRGPTSLSTGRKTRLSPLNGEMVQALRGHGGEVREGIYPDAGPRGRRRTRLCARIGAIRLVRRDPRRPSLRDPGVPSAYGVRHSARQSWRSVTWWSSATAKHLCDVAPACVSARAGKVCYSAFHRRTCQVTKVSSRKHQVMAHHLPLLELAVPLVHSGYNAYEAGTVCSYGVLYYLWLIVTVRQQSR